MNDYQEYFNKFKDENQTLNSNSQQKKYSENIKIV